MDDFVIYLETNIILWSNLFCLDLGTGLLIIEIIFFCVFSFLQPQWILTSRDSNSRMSHSACSMTLGSIWVNSMIWQTWPTTQVQSCRSKTSWKTVRIMRLVSSICHRESSARESRRRRSFQHRWGVELRDLVVLYDL